MHSARSVAAPSVDSPPRGGFLEFALEAAQGHSLARGVAALCRHLGRDLGVDRISVLLDVDGQLVPFVSAHADGSEDRDAYAKWRAISNAPRLAGLLVEEPLALVSDPTALFGPDLVADFRVKPFIAAALSDQHGGFGALVVEGPADQLDSILPLVDAVRPFVGTIAQSAQAVTSQDRDRREAEALLEVIETLSRSTSLKAVLAAVARSTARVTGFDRASVLLLDEQGELRPKMSQFADGHHDEEAWATFRAITTPLPAASRVLDTGEPAAYEDPTAVPELIPPEWTEPFHLRSVLFLPLMAWDQSFGVMILDHREPRSIGPRRVRIAQGVAGQGAVAIGLTRLLERESRAREQAVAASQALGTRERQQAAVAYLGQRALTETDIDVLCSETVRVVAETLAVDFCEVLDLVPDCSAFLLRAGVGMPAERVGKTLVPNDELSQAAYTLRSGAPVIVEDMDTETRFRKNPKFTEHGIRSGMSVVIGRAQEPHGVLGVHSRERRTFAPHEVSFLQSTANVLASAIDRAQAEAALRHSQHHFQAILDTASDAIVSIDANHHIVLFNQEAEKMFGYTADEILGSPLAVLIPSAVGSKDGAFGALLGGGRNMAERADVTAVRNDGTQFLAAVTLSKLERGDEVTFTTIIRDMTEHRAAQQRLEELVESKGELIASVSHELRTPLTGILGFIEVLRDSGHDFTPNEQHSMIEAAAGEAADLSNIVDDLLAAARTEMGTLKVARVGVDLGAQAAQVVEARDEFAAVKVLGEPCKCRADPSRVRQILRNLLTNAVRYGGDDIEIRFEEHPKTVVLAVADNGPGIPKAERHRIFQPYERSSLHPGLPGSVGLGLTVSRNLARLMGGDLTYDYRDGMSVFELRLPKPPG